MIIEGKLQPEVKLFLNLYSLMGGFRQVVDDVGRYQESEDLIQWLKGTKAEITEMIQQTTEFGVQQPLKDGVATKEFWTWYKKIKKKVGL